MAENSTHTQTVMEIHQDGTTSKVSARKATFFLDITKMAKEGDLLRLILALKIQPEIVHYKETQHGNTLLHIAAKKQHTPCINTLLDFYPNPCIQNNAGEKPSDMAPDIINQKLWKLEVQRARQSDKSR